MKPTIHLLDPLVTNQIAAGEVVESLVSVAKELIENSLDAGAKTISIWVDDSYSLRIEDDGVGMGREDLVLSIQRYATSKIRHVQDLLQLTTMGFRGEALASIASVSRMRMLSSDGGLGTSLDIEAGAILQETSIARNRGTTVEVKDLFFNMPARRKFQKSEGTVLRQVLHCVESIALVRHDVSFCLRTKGTLKGQFFAEAKKNRLESIFGSVGRLLESQELWLALAPRDQALPQRRRQWIFVNGRLVVSGWLMKAVQQGLAFELAPDTHLPFILSLQIHPDRVDVNVHPQKKEVRLLDEQEVFQQIVRLLRHDQFVDGPRASLKEEGSFPMFRPQEMSWKEEPPSMVNSQLLPIEEVGELLWVEGHFLFVRRERLLLVDLARLEGLFLWKLSNKGRQHPLLGWQTWLVPVVITMERSLFEELAELNWPIRQVGSNEVAFDELPWGVTPDRLDAFLHAWRQQEQGLVQFCRRKEAYSWTQARLLWQALRQEKDLQGSARVVRELDVEVLERIMR
jgi:DNA mismatch repair protein MutL